MYMCVPLLNILPLSIYVMHLVTQNVHRIDVIKRNECV